MSVFQLKTINVPDILKGSVQTIRILILGFFPGYPFLLYFSQMLVSRLQVMIFNHARDDLVLIT